MVDAERRRPAGDGARHLRGGGRGLGDAVVLHDDQQREPPERGQVERLVDRALPHVPSPMYTQARAPGSVRRRWRATPAATGRLSPCTPVDR
nr:hypothetical protein GCM10020093_104320 [Planobispora longispora]